MTVRGSKADAERRLTELLAQVDAGAVTADSRRLRLGAWLEEWGRDHLGAVRPRTRFDYIGNTRHLPPALLGTYLDRLDRRVIQRAINGIAEERGARTANLHGDVLRIALASAEDHGLLARNPARRLVRPKPPYRERRVLTPAQAAQFLERANALGPLGAAALRLLLLQGLRPCELLGLRWTDLEGDAVRVRRSLVHLPGGGWAVDAPKTPQGVRTLDLGDDPVVLDLLA